MAGAEKRHSRTASLSRCSSLLSCFNGSGQESSYEPITANLSGQRKPPTMQLGSRASKRSISFSCACAGKVKEALEAAKKGGPHISQLFVGGQLFMPKFGPTPHKHTFSPSIGFLHMATTTSSSSSMESSLHDR